MKTFIELRTEDLKMLGLHPIQRFAVLQKAVRRGEYYKLEQGYANRTVRRQGGHFQYREPVPETVCVKVGTFEDMTIEDLVRFGYPVNGKSIKKLLFLQEYLRGNVTGTYREAEYTNPDLADARLESEFGEKLQKKDEKIARLEETVAVQKEEIARLKKELKDTLLESKAYVDATKGMIRHRDGFMEAVEKYEMLAKKFEEAETEAGEAAED